MGADVRECRCAECRSGQDHPLRAEHRAMNVMMGQLDERRRRLYAATEAKRLGWGGVRRVELITGLNRSAIRRGRLELAAEVPAVSPGRVRASGGGRPTIERSKPGIKAALQTLVESETAGDPEGEGRWVRASLRELQRRLAKQGYAVSHQTVANLLRAMKYRLRVNAKEKSGPSHPERDTQFRQIEQQVADFRASGDPIISVDTKKRNSLASSRTPAVLGASNRSG